MLSGKSFRNLVTDETYEIIRICRVLIIRNISNIEIGKSGYGWAGFESQHQLEAMSSASLEAGLMPEMLCRFESPLGLLHLSSARNLLVADSYRQLINSFVSTKGKFFIVVNYQFSVYWGQG